MRVRKRGCAWAGLIVAAPFAAYLTYLIWTGFFAADECLDRGGSYHFDRHACSFTENYRGEVPSFWPF